MRSRSGRTIGRRDLLLAGAGVAMIGTPSFASRAAAATGPQRGGVLHAVLNPEPPLLILGVVQNGPAVETAGKIYSGLLSYGFDLKPVPSLAESYEISEDGRTYTFHLRRNATWHDGRKLTSADVLFTTRDMLPKTHPRARLNFGHVATFEAPDDYTMVYRLKEPFDPFIYVFDISSAPIMPKHIYDGTDYRNNPANATPIGTGPFKFKEWVKGSYIHLVRHDGYWEPKQPYLDEIFFHIIPDASLREAALEHQDVGLTSYWDIPLSDVPRLKKLPFLDMTTKGNEFTAEMAFLEINNTRPPLNDKRFRQAMAYAIDKNFIRDNIFFGLGRVATGPVSSVTNFYEPNVTRYDHNPKRAEQLLDEMGLKRKPDGSRAKIEMIPLPYGEVWTELAEYFKQALGKVGIQVVLRATDVAGWSQADANGDYDVTFNYEAQFGDPALGVARTYISSNIRKGVLFANASQYRNPQVDDLFARGAAARGREERQKIYSGVQRILVDDVPVLWLLELQFPVFTSRKLHDVIVSGLGVYDSFARAYFA